MSISRVQCENFPFCQSECESQAKLFFINTPRNSHDTQESNTAITK